MGVVLQLYPQNPLCGLGRGPERWGGARLAGWECAHCVSYAHERFFAEMTPVTMLQRGGPFLLFLLPIQLFLTLSHTQCSFPAPLPPQRKIALQTLALLPGQASMAIPPAKSEPYLWGGAGSNAASSFCVAPTLWACTQPGRGQRKESLRTSPVAGEEVEKKGLTWGFSSQPSPVEKRPNSQRWEGLGWGGSAL